MPQTAYRTGAPGRLLLRIGLPAVVALLIPVLGRLLLRSRLPDHVVRHAGPDGIGYGSLNHFLIGTLAIAVALFLVGALLIRGFLRPGYWYLMEKFAAVAIFCGGYGAVAVAMVTVFVTPAAASFRDPEAVFGWSLLGFVIAYTAAAILHARLLPRTSVEPAPED